MDHQILKYDHSFERHRAVFSRDAVYFASQGISKVRVSLDKIQFDHSLLLPRTGSLFKIRSLQTKGKQLIFIPSLRAFGAALIFQSINQILECQTLSNSKINGVFLSFTL